MYSIKKTYHLLFFLVVILLVFSTQVSASDLSLYWNPVKGTLTAGYKLHIGFKPRSSPTNYSSYKIHLDVGKKTNYLLTNIDSVKADTLYFAVTIYDQYGNDGPYSTDLKVPLRVANTTTSSLPTTSSITTTSSMPTTSSIRATTSIPDDGGGSGGGHHHLTTTTTVYIPPPTTSSTTSTIPECTKDADCSDHLFCNGIERCVNGICVEGERPCAPGQICRDSLDECWDIIAVQADSVFKNASIKRPGLLQIKWSWMLVHAEKDTSFTMDTSIISCAGPEDDSQGVAINPRRLAFKAGKFIFIPITVARDATPGVWTVTIKTEVANKDKPFVETIETNLTIE